MKNLKLFEEYNDDNDAMRKLYVVLDVLGIPSEDAQIYNVDQNVEYADGSKSLVLDGDSDVLIYYNDDTDDEFTADWPLDDSEWTELNTLFTK